MIEDLVFEFTAIDDEQAIAIAEAILSVLQDEP